MKKTITRPNRSPLAACVRPLLFTCLTTSILHAVDNTWTGASNSGWGTAANWVGGTAPAFNSGDDLIFSDTTWTRHQTFLQSNRTVRSITYNDNWGAITPGRVRFNTTNASDGTGSAVNLTLSSTTDIATVTLTSGMTGSMVWGRDTTTTVSGNLVLADPTVFDVQGTGTIEVRTDITETGAPKTVTKNGAGTAIFSRTCSYTGDTIINAGTLRGVVVGDSPSTEIILNGPTATFSTSVTIASGSWNCAALTAAAAGTLEFNFGAVAPSTTVSPLIVAGLADFSAAAPQVSVVVSAGLAAGTYPLLTWGSTSGAAPTVVTVSTLSPNTAARLSVSGSTLNLVIEPSATHYWDGDDNILGFAAAGGTWAAPTAGTLTSGWSTSATGEATVNGNSVTTATADNLNLGTDTNGLTSGTITVSGNVAAGNITIGSASGSATFSGYSSGGNIQFGQSGQNVTLDTRNATSTILETVLSGTANGSFTKTGPGILQILGNNSGWGSGSNFYLNQGQVRLGSVNSPSTSGSNSLGGVGGFAVKLGATSGTNTASLYINNGINIPNAIEVRSGSSGAKSITTASNVISPTLSGAITANDAVTITNASNGTLTLSGALAANQDITITTTNTTGNVAATNAGNSVTSTKKVIFTNSATATGSITDSALWSGAGSVIYNPSGLSSSLITISGQKTHSGGSRLAATSNSNSVAVITESSTGPAGAPTSGPFGTGTLSMGSTTGISGDVPKIRAATTADITIANLLSIKSPHFVTVADEKSLIFTGNVATALTPTCTITSDVGSTVPGKSVEFHGVISGGGRGIAKAGSGTVVLKGANSYTGTTFVNAGTLTLGASNVIADASNISIGAGTLDVGAGFTDTVGTLDVTASATINLGTGAQLVFADSNTIGGTGVWAGSQLNITGAFVSGSSIKFATSSGLTIGQLAKISVNGSGLGTYTLNPSGYLISAASSPYSTWATGAVFTDDANGDGVDNGLAWILGAADKNVSALNKLPTVSTPTGFLQLDFTRVNPYSPAKLYVEYSTSLTGWTKLEIPVLATGTHPLGNGIDAVVTSPGSPTPDTIQIKIPTSLASGGKLFARLSSTEN